MIWIISTFLKFQSLKQFIKGTKNSQGFIINSQRVYTKSFNSNNDFAVTKPVENIERGSDCLQACVDNRKAAQADIDTGKVPEFVCTAYQYGDKVDANWKTSRNGLYCMIGSLKSYPPRLLNETHPNTAAESGFINDIVRDDNIFNRFIEEFIWVGIFFLLFVAYQIFFNYSHSISVIYALVPLGIAIFAIIWKTFVGFKNEDDKTDLPNNCDPDPSTKPNGANWSLSCRSDAISQSPTTGTCYNSCIVDHHFHFHFPIEHKVVRGCCKIPGHSFLV